MTISMYQASVPTLIHFLKNLGNIIEKAIAHAEEKKIEPSVLVNYRLTPDMFPFSRQVQIATDMAKGGAARLAGVEPPKFEDNETTLQELVARVQKTVAFLDTIKAEQVDGSEQRAIVLAMRHATLNFEGQPYLLNFVLPNFYFHVSTAYAILRHCGVNIGKNDFLGAA